jgi:heme-degrading monooxygenase HmoA
MFLFVSHLTVPPQDHEALESHFRRRSHLVEGCPGFLYLQLLKPRAGQATHTFVTAWTDQAAFKSYMASDARARAHGNEPGDILARTTVRHEAFEVLMDSRLAPEWLSA